MNGTILVVDDDPEILDVIGKAIERFGHRADTAMDVDQAIAMLDSDEYDILIVDKNMTGPDGNPEAGMEVLKHLRRRAIRTEAIMITGYATIDNAIQAMRLGAFDFIAKPFSLEVLKEKIDRILDFRQFINPDNTIRSFKEFYNELLNVFENRSREIDARTDKTLHSILSKVEYFFRVQKEREKIMIAQREVLAEIASNAEELKEKLTEQGISHELLENICVLSNQRF